MPVPPKVLDLIEVFQRNAEEYLSPHFNEAMLRQQFVNPWFKCLGWDMENEQGYAEAYKDVIHEASLKIGVETKAPDYCFRIGGTAKFYLEAKKPSVNIEDDPAPAFQLRRYAWSAKLPLSILTNFEEFAVYDCRVKPVQTDKASTARILYLGYGEYDKEWDSIAGVFSRDAVLKGSFDKYAESKKGKKGTATVDAAFLAEIESWREELAKNLALRNPRLTSRELNFAVQITIDRIIFLRMCEDRGIEPYAQLRELQFRSDIYDELRKLYVRADERYNSGLFHFIKEPDRPEAPDELTPKLKIDDKVLKSIFKRLYYPDSPYEFSVLPVEILGQVYEQFLGKVIRLTAGHQAKVEEKPEVKKAGGVYYTPSYIVDYIVKHTVGKLLEGKTPKQAAKLRVLDPACGSGSFLLGAYKYLLDWHLEKYQEDGPEKHKKEVFQSAGGAWRLTTAEKKRILLNNIYGVDIDPQAVEVTKLSLLLKVLEGESQETLLKQLQLYHARALPDLASNTKCGNSLVEANFNENHQRTLFDDDEDRISAFDWKHEFPQVFKAAGFDAVIGNPPYSYRNATEEMLRPYYLSHYECAEGNFDLYKFFVEKSLKLLRPQGRFGLIINASFLIQPTFKKLRKLLLTKSSIERLAPLGPGAFSNATVDTSILVARRDKPTRGHQVEIQLPRQAVELASTGSHRTTQSRFVRNIGNVFSCRLSDDGANLVDRLFKQFPRIETGFEFGVGINSGFIRDELVADRRIDERYHRMVTGSGISRYGPETTGWIMYDRDYVRSRGTLGRTLPAEHLLKSPKILVVRTRNLSLPRRIVATLDRAKAYNLNRLSNIVARPSYSLRGLLGILNSRLFNWLYSTRFLDYEIKPVYLRVSPLADANDRRLTAAADRILSLTSRLGKARTSHEQTAVKRKLAATDRAIDQLVYELYDLTPEEIRIVEEGAGS